MCKWTTETFVAAIKSPICLARNIVTVVEKIVLNIRAPSKMPKIHMYNVCQMYE